MAGECSAGRGQPDGPATSGQPLRQRDDDGPGRPARRPGVAADAAVPAATPGRLRVPHAPYAADQQRSGRCRPAGHGAGLHGHAVRLWAGRDGRRRTGCRIGQRQRRCIPGCAGLGAARGEPARHGHAWRAPGRRRVRLLADAARGGAGIRCADGAPAAAAAAAARPGAVVCQRDGTPQPGAVLPAAGGRGPRGAFGWRLWCAPRCQARAAASRDGPSAEPGRRLFSLPGALPDQRLLAQLGLHHRRLQDPHHREHGGHPRGCQALCDVWRRRGPGGEAPDRRPSLPDPFPCSGDREHQYNAR
mmetsp:Transcript_31856/g.75647  ORF Transcript_31856/g.75647 Transcript_31856/m.75647 type:complete len:303 (-) Transcript_31856:1248-2156(-)